MQQRHDRSNVVEPPTGKAADELTRRSFLHKGAAAFGGIAVASSTVATHTRLDASASTRSPMNQRSPKQSSFLDLVRVPDKVTAFESFAKTLPEFAISLERKADQWSGQRVVVESRVERDALVLTLAAPSTPIAAVHVRWNTEVKPGIRALGDAWERSYGELGWRNLIAERVMPWYFATHDGVTCEGYGVKTDARSLCFWQLDSQGVSLWLNVTNGGNGVELGERQLTMATVVTRHGKDGEDSIEAIAGLCRKMCSRESLKTLPVYGANDWNYSYGQSTAETILRDTDFIVELSPSGGVRPFSVIDGGWSNGTPAWPDMGRLAADIKLRTARPGLWVRPLEAPKDGAPRLLLPDARFGEKQERASERAYDPTIPEAQTKISDKLRQAAGWGYEMVKHDFTTYDLLGQWGFEMGPQPTLPGWSLHDRSRTNAEVIAELYGVIREAAGPRVVIDGCNTVGHLGQGIFDLQRSGDDTSGHQWERTRRMGVNTISFRLPQHGTFFTLDADLVGITEAIPWDFNRQWLDLLARSGTATLVSAGPSARGQEQRSALRNAFQSAAAGGVAAIPVDWLETSSPEHWRAADNVEKERRYHWSGTEGTSPFLSP